MFGNRFWLIFLWKAILLSGVLLLTLFVFFRFTFINFNPYIVIFSIILLLAEMHTVFHLYGMFYSLWPRKYADFTKNKQEENLSINIFICVCGEPESIVRETIVAAKNAVSTYIDVVRPKKKPQIYVLNDGKAAKKENWRMISQLAKSLKVHEIIRSTSLGFKAGNINNALRVTKKNNKNLTIDIILDSDFSLHRDGLIKIIKPFADKGVDFVQTPQRYKNEKTWVAKAAAAHQIFFFDHICPAKAHDNALFLCGTNFAIRRNALLDVGGMDEEFITEDYSTSLKLHMSGKKGVFIKEVLAEGIAPSSLKAYFNQQQRWSKGSLDVSRAYLKQILFGPLTFKQKFHYMLSASYYLIGVRDLILILAPIPYLLFGISLVSVNTNFYLLTIYAPLLAYNLTLYALLFRNPLKSLVLDVASFPIFVSSFLSALFKKNLSFIVTIKNYEKENPFNIYKLQLMVILFLASALYIGSEQIPAGGAILNYFWATFSTFILSFGFYLIVRENYNTTLLERILVGKNGIFPTAVRLATTKSAKMAYSFLFLFAAFHILYYSPTIREISHIRVLGANNNDYENIKLKIPLTGMYYGYYLPALNSHPDNPGVTYINNEKTSLVMFYQDWNGERKFDSDYLRRIATYNVVPVITWEPWDSQDKTNNKYSPDLIIDGEHDKFIRQWAQDAARYNAQFFLRFAHEMNGSWYPWGSEDNPQRYIKMWKHVHKIFEEEGASNVIWVWSPNNTDSKGDSTNILSYYPGDEYVDWTGFSGFNWGNDGASKQWISFEKLTYNTYIQLERIRKPIMVSETSSSSNGGNKHGWLEDTVSRELQLFPNIKAVVFFNQDINNADFALSSGASFEKIWEEHIKNNDYFVKNPLFSAE